MESQELAKKLSDRDTCEEIAVPANAVCFCFIISKIGTIKGQFHEANEGNNTALCKDFAANDFEEQIHLHSDLRSARFWL